MFTLTDDDHQDEDEIGCNDNTIMADVTVETTNQDDSRKVKFVSYLYMLNLFII